MRTLRNGSTSCLPAHSGGSPAHTEEDGSPVNICRARPGTEARRGRSPSDDPFAAPGGEPRCPGGSARLPHLEQEVAEGPVRVRVAVESHPRRILQRLHDLVGRASWCRPRPLRPFRRRCPSGPALRSGSARCSRTPAHSPRWDRTRSSRPNPGLEGSACGRCLHGHRACRFKSPRLEPMSDEIVGHDVGQGEPLAHRRRRVTKRLSLVFLALPLERDGAPAPPPPARPGLRAGSGTRATSPGPWWRS